MRNHCIIIVNVIEGTPLPAMVQPLSRIQRRQTCAVLTACLPRTHHQQTPDSTAMNPALANGLLLLGARESTGVLVAAAIDAPHGWPLTTVVLP